jgi:putative membrane protein
MGFFFSPFRWLWIIFGIIVLSIFAVVVASTIYFGISLGHAVLFSPHVFTFPFFGFGFAFLGILVLALFLGLIFRPFRWRRGYYSGRWGYYGQDSAMDSLRQRYARGEITRDQFEQMAGDLEKHR